MHSVKGVVLLNSNGGLIFDDWIVNSIDMPRLDVDATMSKYKDRGILLLEGGADINPNLYGEQNRYSNYSDTRDTWEKHLYNKAKEYGLPIFGICRGHQLVAALNGGTLYQDIYRDTGIVHRAGKLKCEGLMSEWYPDGCAVNSLHHQAVKDVPPNAHVLARSLDGIIEALVYPEDRMFTVQFHPEIMGDSEFLEHVVSYLLQREDICALDSK